MTFNSYWPILLQPVSRTKPKIYKDVSSVVGGFSDILFLQVFLKKCPDMVASLVVNWFISERRRVKCSVVLFVSGLKTESYP